MTCKGAPSQGMSSPAEPHGDSAERQKEQPLRICTFAMLQNQTGGKKTNKKKSLRDPERVSQESSRSRSPHLKNGITVPPPLHPVSSGDCLPSSPGGPRRSTWSGAQVLPQMLTVRAQTGAVRAASSSLSSGERAGSLRVSLQAEAAWKVP